MRNSTIREVAKLDAAMEKDPPRITWVLDPIRRVMVAAFIYDPHRDSGHNGAKDACKRDHPYTPENTLIKPEGWRQCRACKNEVRKPLTSEQKQRAADLKRQRRANNPLLAAARTEI